MSIRKNEAVWIENRQLWRINVQSEGERRSFYDPTPGKKGKVLCEQKADKWLEEKLVNENTRTEVLLDRWYKKLQLSTSLSNCIQYEKYIRLYITPVMGLKRISRINQSDLQSVIDNAYALPDSVKHPRKKKKDPKESPSDEEITPKKLAYKTLCNIRACLMAFIKYCRDIKATTMHPETLTIPAAAEKHEKTIAEPDDIVKLFTVSTTLYRNKRIEDRYIHAYRFCVLTGVRPGELIALKSDNIQDKRVKITQSINNYKQTTKGKNDNARRTYSLDDHALRVLAEQSEMLKLLSQISPYVFPSKTLGPMTQERFRKSWKQYCKSNGISGANTPYELRHTFVSVNTDMPEALKKLVIGHSKGMDTEGIYGHEKADDMEKAAEHISAAFRKILGW